MEFRLFWEGGLNRSDLTERFGVSVPRRRKTWPATANLRRRTSSTDPSRKRYVSAQKPFRPLFLQPNPDRYLAQLKAMSDGILDVGDTWIETIPPTGVLPVPTRRINAPVLRALLRCHSRKVRDSCRIPVYEP